MIVVVFACNEGEGICLNEVKQSSPFRKIQHYHDVEPSLQLFISIMTIISCLISNIIRSTNHNPSPIRPEETLWVEPKEQQPGSPSKTPDMISMALALTHQLHPKRIPLDQDEDANHAPRHGHSQSRTMNQRTNHNSRHDSKQNHHSQHPHQDMFADVRLDEYRARRPLTLCCTGQDVELLVQTQEICCSAQHSRVVECFGKIRTGCAALNEDLARVILSLRVTDAELVERLDTGNSCGVEA